MLRKNVRPGLIAIFIAGSTGGLAIGLSAQEQATPYTTVQDIQSGQQLFARHCSICHGVDAAGGDIAPDLTTGEFQHAGTDAGLFNVISDGVPDTPMLGINRGRTDQSVWQLVAYLRSLSGGPRVAVAGDANMWSVLKRDLLMSQRIETSSMPAYAGTLNDGELEDLVAYLYGLTREDQGGAR